MITFGAVLDRLARLVESRNASSFFINGVPGAGKSYLLKSLATQLPRRVATCLVLGPYVIPDASLEDLFAKALNDFRDSGVVDVASGQVPSGLDLSAGLFWLKRHGHLDVAKNVMVLIDTDRAGTGAPLETVGALFSNLRHIDGTWDFPTPRVHCVLTGHWSHEALARHYDRIQTSHPYTVGYNYVVWEGMGVDDTAALIERRGQTGGDTALLAETLYELTGGHAGAITDILGFIGPKELSLQRLLQATRAVAESSPSSTRLLGEWQRLSPEARETLRRLLSRRHVRLDGRDRDDDTVFTAGIARNEVIGKQRYLGFASWFSELVARLHLRELGLTDDVTPLTNLDTLVPTVASVNQEAYRLIHAIENAARNFAVIALQKLGASGEDFLKGLVRVRDDRGNGYVDIHDRAEKWRDQSRREGLAELNPLVAYLSTTTLADLIGEIAAKLKSDHWSRIARSMSDLAPLRDAVMHNQLVDTEAITRLEALKEEIYRALNDEP